MKYSALSEETAVHGTSRPNPISSYSLINAIEMSKIYRIYIAKYFENKSKLSKSVLNEMLCISLFKSIDVYYLAYISIVREK